MNQIYSTGVSELSPQFARCIVARIILNDGSEPLEDDIDLIMRLYGKVPYDLCEFLAEIRPIAIAVSRKLRLTDSVSTATKMVQQRRKM